MSSPAAVRAHARPSLDPPTIPLVLPVPPRRQRLIGVDVARGLAVLGMIATHTLPMATDAGSPTTASLVAAGRSAATFVFVAGVSVAFLSGGPGVRGRERAAASAGLLVRAVIVLVLGLLLGLLAPLNGIWGILPFYALLFVLALPLLGLRAPALAVIAAAVLALGPALLVTTAGSDLPYAGADDPTFGTLVNDPLGQLIQLLLSGAYPVVVYLGYLTAGMAVGRLDLSSRRVAWWLLGGGLALAAGARAVSWYLLYPLGGLARLVQEGGASDDDSARTATQLLAEEHQPLSTWWHLALPAPHSHTPIDLLHTLGSAAAVLGVALLLTRVRVLRRLLSPLAAAGSLALTLYCAHLVLLATGVLSGQPASLFGAMVVGGVALALAWRRWIGHGPLEKLVSLPATATRRAVAAHLPHVLVDDSGHAENTSRRRSAIRGAAVLVAAVVTVAALGFGVWTRAQVAGPPAEDDAATAQYESDASAEDDSEDAAGPEAPTPAGPAAAPETPAAGDPDAADPARFCALSAEHAALLDTESDPTQAVLEKVAATMTEMQRVAPAELREPVAVLAGDARAEAGAADAAPDSSAVETAETTIDQFEETNCG